LVKREERGLGPSKKLLFPLSPGPLLTLTKEAQELPEEEASKRTNGMLFNFHFGQLLTHEPPLLVKG